MQTLDDFLTEMGKRPWSSYVKHPRFSYLYVRRGPYLIDGEFRNDTVTIATITARHKNKGHFRKLVDFILSKKLNIHVESVLDDNFAAKLEHMGFKRCNEQQGRNYFLRNENGK